MNAPSGEFTSDELRMMQRAVGMLSMRNDLTPKRNCGRRNRYAVMTFDSDRIAVWDGLVRRKFAKTLWSNQETVAFCLTEAGCEAIGMHRAAVLRAIED